MAAVNLGRSRGDNTGSQNTILNSIKPGKVAFPKFTGKNAGELNALAEFIEQKLNSSNDFNRDLTSSNVDTTLERIHSAMLKLKEASDADDSNAYEQIKADIASQVRDIVVGTGKEKPKEVLWSDEDKDFLKDLIAASTLTEAKEKTKDQTGQNGLTKDDIDRALARTVEEQQTLNNDVINAAEKASKIEDGQKPDNVKDELQQMFNDNKSDDSALDDIANKSSVLFLKLQDLVSSQVGMLNARMRIVGDNFKNSPLFDYKNPFTSSVGKMPSVVDTLSGTFSLLNDKVQAGIEKAKVPFDAVSGMFSSLNDKVQAGIEKAKLPFEKVQEQFKSISSEVSSKVSSISDGIIGSSKDMLASLNDKVQAGIEKAKVPFDAVSGMFSSLNDKVQAGIERAKVPFEKFSDSVNAVKDSISSKVSSISDGIIGSSKDMLASLNDKVQAGIEKAKLPFEKVSALMTDAKAGITAAVTKIRAPFDKVANGAKKIGKGISNIKNGIANRAKATKDFITNIPKLIIGKIKDLLLGMLKTALELIKKPLAMIKSFFVMIGVKLLGILSKLGKAILTGLKTVMFFIFKAVFSIIKKIGGKFKKGKAEGKEKKEKKPKLPNLFGMLKKPMSLGDKVIKKIASTTVAMMKGKKKRKKPGMLSKVTAVLPPMTSKEKKEKKKIGGLFNTLGKFMAKISDIIKNIVKHICDIIGLIVVALCTAIAKGIGIILRAIFLTPWGLIILASILLISIGILLISLAVKKLVDYIVDDLGPIIKEKLKMIDPETLNRFMNSVSTFIETFSSILAGVFAPLVVIGTVIKNLILPMGELIKTVANVVVKILKPILEGIGELILILLKPILKVLKIVAKAIAGILMLIMPLLEAVFMIIKGIIALIVPLISFVFNVVGKILMAIGKIISVIWDVVSPFIDFVLDVIVGTIKVIAAILKFVIKVFLIPFKIVIWVIKKIIDGLVIAYNFAKEKVMKAYEAVKNSLIAAYEWVKEKIIAVFEVVSAIVSAVIDGVKFVIKLLLFPIILPIKLAVMVIKGIVEAVKFVIDKIKEFWNWLKDKLASIEIPLPWPLKNIHPFGWLKGSNDSKQESPAPETNEEALKIIDSLNEQIAELQGKYDLSLKTIKELQEKLKVAASMTISKFAVAALVKNSIEMTKLLCDGVVPALKQILETVNNIYKTITKDDFLEIEEATAESKKSAGMHNDIAEQRLRIEEPAAAPVERTEKVYTIDMLQAKIAEDSKKTSVDVDKTSNKQTKSLEITKENPFGKLENAANKSINEKNERMLEFERRFDGGNPELEFEEKSVSKQFSPISKMNNREKETILDISDSFAERKANVADEFADDSDDITNVDLKTFLQKMFENVDISFAKISDKLDNPLVLPMPTPMNINNLALLGTN